MDAELAQIAQLGWTSELRVTQAEGACQSVLGHSAIELVGMPLHEALGTSLPRAQAIHAKASSASSLEIEFLTLTRAHEDLGKTLRLTLTQKDGAPVASVLNLSAMLQGAPPLEIGRLSSSLSHEIRNPLSSVKMAVQTLARNPGMNDRDKRRLTIANREIRTMERMLWLLSEYGRDSTSMLELLDLKSVVQEAGQLIEPELAERKIQLVTHAGTEPLRVRLDAGRLRPVLAQVLLNIAHGHPEGSTVTVKVFQEGAFVRMDLEDSSMALPPSEKDTVFEPFGSRLARGSGLSLAALKRVMLSLGGTVEAHGETSPPTRFTLCFPL